MTSDMTGQMKRDLARFERICKFIYGERWQSDVARSLKFNERTVRAWVQGRTRITPPVWFEVAKRLEKKIALAPAVQDLMNRQISALREEG
jgi:plasmid maintenance system antidote protein VapI